MTSYIPALRSAPEAKRQQHALRTERTGTLACDQLEESADGVLLPAQQGYILIKHTL